MYIMNNKTILITGGTGSFGTTFTKKLLNRYQDIKIVIFSRDEEKQHRLRLELNDNRVRFEIGDVRDRDRVNQVMKDIDLVFHAAALKQVPSCEFFPMEAVKTNILGTNNVLDAALTNRVRKVVCLSTDKSVYPINAMGMSKALMEKIAITKSKTGFLDVCVTRYGNVMASRGSVIPIWYEAAKNNQPITITNGNMTRFLLTLDDAVELVLYALENGENGDTFIKKAPACTMSVLAEAVIAVANSASKTVNVGMRHGEKMHESLIGEEEMSRALDCGDYFKILPDSRDLSYDIFFENGQNSQARKSYTSANTNQLTQEQVEDLLQDIL